MDDKKPDNVDEFEEEIEEGGFKDPLPHFDEEVEYLSEPNPQSKKFISGMMKKPAISVGWLGILLIILVALFLFLPKGSDNMGNEELIILKSRVEDLESRQNQMDVFEQKLSKIETDLLKGLQLGDRLDQVEQLLISKIDEIEKDIDSLQNQMEGLKKSASEKTVETKQPKTAKPREKKPVEADEVKYHTVQKGENVYRIGLKYNLTEEELLELNNLDKGSLIYPGQKLRVSK